MNCASFTQLYMTEQAAGVWLISLNRPKALNALNQLLLEQLHQALDRLELTAGVRAVLITGSGDKAFAAGADITGMMDMNSIQAREFSQFGMELMQRIERFPLPVIALVNGYCLGGGCELAMSCDFMIASEKAVFGQPEVSLGVPPGFGGTQRLVRRVGRPMAAQLLMTGEKIDAAEALRIGLCNQVVPAENLLQRGLELAAKMQRNAPQAIRFCKDLINSAPDMDIDNGCRKETDLFALSFATEDQKEGMAAFYEQREPLFTGK